MRMKYHKRLSRTINKQGMSSKMQFQQPKSVL